MSASLGLYRLQQVDSQIDRVRSRLESIHGLLENDLELRGAMSALEKAAGDHHHAKNEMKNAEAEVQSQRIKIEQAESSLYGGRVQNPKELQDLQRDVASLKKHLATLEDKELQAMIDAEKAEAGHSNAKSLLDQIQSRRGDEHKKLIDEQSIQQADLERLHDERQAVIDSIEGHLLTVYEELRKHKRGVAVTGFNDNSCSACGANLNASIQQNTKSSKQLIFCPTCGRILYAS